MEACIYPLPLPPPFFHHTSDRASSGVVGSTHLQCSVGGAFTTVPIFARDVCLDDRVKTFRYGTRGLSHRVDRIHSLSKTPNTGAVILSCDCGRTLTCAPDTPILVFTGDASRIQASTGDPFSDRRAGLEGSGDGVYPPLYANMRLVHTLVAGDYVLIYSDVRLGHPTHPIKYTVALASCVGQSDYALARVASVAPAPGGEIYTTYLFETQSYTHTVCANDFIILGKDTKRLVDVCGKHVRRVRHVFQNSAADVNPLPRTETPPLESAPNSG